MTLPLCGLVRSQVNQYHYISSTTVSIATKLPKLVNYHEGLLSIILFHPLVSWSCKIMWQTKTIISPLLQNVWTKTWQKGHLSWLLFTHVFCPSVQMNTWFYETKWKINFTTISLLPQCLCSVNLTGRWLTLSDFYS